MPQAAPDPEPTDAEVAASVAETVMHEKGRGARFARTTDGGYRRMTPAEVLFERDKITAHALTGAESYRSDQQQSRASTSSRSTLYARVGDREDEDALFERSFAAAEMLAKVQRAVRLSVREWRVVEMICTRDSSDVALERAALRMGINRHLEAVADWYAANDQRDVRDDSAEEMRLIDREAWWTMARVFNPRMSREAFDAAFSESGIEQHQHEAALRQQAAVSRVRRYRSMVTEDQVERRAQELFADYRRRFKVRASVWSRLPASEHARWKDIARLELDEAA